MKYVVTVLLISCYGLSSFAERAMLASSDPNYIKIKQKVDLVKREDERITTELINYFYEKFEEDNYFAAAEYIEGLEKILSPYKNYVGIVFILEKAIDKGTRSRKYSDMVYIPNFTGIVSDIEILRYLDKEFEQDFFNPSSNNTRSFQASFISSIYYGYGKKANRLNLSLKEKLLQFLYNNDFERWEQEAAYLGDEKILEIVKQKFDGYRASPKVSRSQEIRLYNTIGALCSFRATDESIFHSALNLLKQIKEYTFNNNVFRELKSLVSKNSTCFIAKNY